jgi:protocatechuate 3,4-dioxygenase beta subunit
MHKKLALLALVVPLALLGLLFLLQEERGVRAPAPAPATLDGAMEATPEPAVELAQARSPEVPTQREAASAREAPGPVRALARDHVAFAAADARWVDVTVLLPGPLPADDAPALLAFGWLEKEELDLGDIRRVGEKLDLSDAFADELEDDVTWARCALAPSVRLPFPGGARRGLVMVQSRYLYLNPLEVDLSTTKTLTVEPELGAYVTGRCVLLARGGERLLAGKAVHLEFHGRPEDEGLMGWRDQDSRNVRVADDLRFELRALSARRRYAIQARAEGFVGHFELAFSVEPGQHREVEIPFRLGATIEGFVRGDDGQPVAGARVSARGRPMMFAGSQPSATSGADGAFRLLGVPDGKVTLEARHDSWHETTGEPFEVAEGELVGGIELVLRRGLELAGLVLWPDGSPARDASVEAYRVRNQGYLEQVSQGKSDGQGRFVLGGLEEDLVELIAKCAPDEEVLERLGLKGARLAAAQASVALPGEPSATAAVGSTGQWLARLEGVQPGSKELVLRLLQPIRVTGLLVDDRGAAIPEFSVEARPSARRFQGSDSVHGKFDSADGSFALDVFHAGEWRFEASAEGYSAGPEPVVARVPLAEEPLRLVLARAATVTGRVLDPAGHPQPGARVGGAAPREQPWNGGGTKVTTDAAGLFRMEKVPGASIGLVASHPDWADSEPVSVELRPGEAHADVLLTLRVGGRVTGEVFDAGGRPEAGQNVTCGAGPMDFGNGNSTRTDAAGRFVFEHVTPGRVTVSAMPSEEELMETFSEAEDETAIVGLFGQMRSETVDVVDGGEVHVVLGARPRVPVRVHGRASEAGAGLEGATIFAFAEGGALLQGMKLAKTGADGRYELELDHPGDYVFGVNQEGMNGTGVQFPVEVPEQEEFEQDFELPLGGIAGRVFGPDGAPAAGVPVRLAQQEGIIGIEDLSDSNRLSTASDGSFAFAHLHPGLYSLQVGGSAPWEPAEARLASAIVDGIAVEQDRISGGIEVRLAAPGKLAGSVRDEHGKPVAGAAIFVRDERGRSSSLSACVSDAAGRFTYGGLAPGRVTASARTGTQACADSAPVEIRAGEASEVELQVTTGTFVIVSLLEGDEPVRARLRVLDQDGRRVDDLFTLADLQRLLSEGFSTRERRVGPIPPGKYTLVAVTPDGKEARKSVTIEPGQEERHVRLKLK